MAKVGHAPSRGKAFCAEWGGALAKAAATFPEKGTSRARDDLEVGQSVAPNNVKAMRHGA